MIAKGNQLQSTHDSGFRVVNVSADRVQISSVSQPKGFNCMVSATMSDMAWLSAHTESAWTTVGMPVGFGSSSITLKNDFKSSVSNMKSASSFGYSVAASGLSVETDMELTSKPTFNDLFTEYVKLQVIMELHGSTDGDKEKPYLFLDNKFRTHVL